MHTLMWCKANIPKKNSCNEKSQDTIPMEKHDQPVSFTYWSYFRNNLVLLLSSLPFKVYNDAYCNMFVNNIILYCKCICKYYFSILELKRYTGI